MRHGKHLGHTNYQQKHRAVRMGLYLTNNPNMEQTNANTRTRIEDMTLGEINEARMRLEDKIGEAIQREIDEFSKSYDWGKISVDALMEIEYMEKNHDYFREGSKILSHIKRDVEAIRDVAKGLK